MATLVLSTIGNALGGPVGGAIGALIGQSIDQQLLGSPKGPRLGDLRVHTSDYGMQIPRIYGTMRAAGSVIWATDLVESTQTSGAKGQSGTTTSYSVSLAVAISSRPVTAIKRIWADGKLLRGTGGDFKVSTTFRFYDGSEDQAIDPLIGSIEGIAKAAAHRGLALAVFENLELADYGNRIPFLTFEIVGDETAPSIGAVLADTSNGLIASDSARPLAGFAAYGSSIKAAIDPLVSSYAINLFDDGLQLRPALDYTPSAVSSDEFGNSADNQAVPRMEREQTAARDVSASLRLRYYDAARDYQTGESRAAASEQPGGEEQVEIAAVLNAADAKSLAQQSLARAWARRDKLTLRLPPQYLALEPGAKLDLALTPELWSVEQCTIEGFVVRVELRPAWRAVPLLSADSGRITANNDVVASPLSLALIDVPNVLQQQANQPTLLLAASTASAGWKQQPVEMSFAGQQIAARTAARKSVLGRTLTVLAPGEPYLIDTTNSVDIELVDTDQWLTSCDDDALAAGANIAAVGRELIQFGGASPIGEGQFRLTRLLRGRGGTEWASSSHIAGDVFCLMDAGAVQAATLPSWSIGAVATATAPDGTAISTTIAAEALRPPTPVNLSASLEPTGELSLSWTRRSRMGFAWVDEIDAPLGETVEQYRVTISASAGATELVSEQPSLIVPAAGVAALGAGPAAIEVRQVGDFAASLPAQLSITLP